MIKELTCKDLKRDYMVEIADISQISPSEEIVGQDRGANALRFGLNVKSKGYNIYVSGMAGSGKTTFAERFAREIAAKEPVPNDILYVHNFNNAKEPDIIYIEASKGKELKEDMEEVINILANEIPKRFNARSYEEEKDRIVKSAQKEKDEIIKNLSTMSKDYNYSIKMSPNGIYFLPIVDGKPLSEEEFEELDEETRDELAGGNEEVQELASKAMRSMKDIDRAARKRLDEMDYNLALFTVGHYFMGIQEKYSSNMAVSKYLSSVKENIISDFDEFLTDNDSDEGDPLSMVMPWMSKRPVEDILAKYSVNLIVDNSSLTGAPVIVNFNPTYTNLVGEVEYENENGNFTTDFTKIKPGILHKANGGYLILQMHDLLNNFYAWETLRRVLKTGEIIIEPIKEYQFGNISVAGIQPKPAKVSFKVILIGSPAHYELLNEYDDEFAKLFKVTAIFDYEMDGSSQNIAALTAVLKNYAEKKHVMPFDAGAVAALAEYSSRIAENQNKLTTKISLVKDMLVEADTWAKMSGSSTIGAAHVRQAIAENENRVNIYQQKYIDMINRGEIMIDTKGAVVGQINGLCVMDTGKHTFGMPTRITASSYMGKAGIVNIEKEAEMSGAIHSKGVQVLIGYFGSKYARKFPLSFSSRICFEQSYNGVDGDSASSTEAYALISSLSGLPINQQLAVTGSINQRGDIQPIGGVSHKIEGFYNVCAAAGLTGKQGVIIPVQNEKDLTLKQEVIDAVRDGKFHIYSISSLDEGIELLMGKKAGSLTAKGSYPRGTVHYYVMKKLKEYYEAGNDGE